jgi:NADH:ubiquinone oxidoreductase subunit E
VAALPGKSHILEAGVTAEDIEVGHHAAAGKTIAEPTECVGDCCAVK